MSQIIFCPYCGHPVANSGELRGWVVFCPTCHGQFQMPAPAAPTMPGAPHLGDPEVEFQETTTRGERLRSDAARTYYAWVAVIIVGLALAVYSALWFFVYREVHVPPPDPTKQGLEWNNADLRQYLSNVGGLDFQPVLYDDPDGGPPAMELTFFTERDGRQVERSLRIYQHTDAGYAKQYVLRRKLDTLEKQEAAQSWGRFSMFGDPYAVSLVVKALQQR